MNVGFDTFFPKTVNTVFIVQNIAIPKKNVRVFNYPIPPGLTRDLLSIPEVSEADIRHALLKGSLRIKLQTLELVVVASNIDLIQFSSDQLAFLQAHGVVNGLTSGISKFAFFQDVLLSGIQNGSNTIFTLPTTDKFIYNNDYKLTLYLNGVRQAYTDNFLVAESGGPGTGYDTVIFVEAPIAGDELIVDYFKA